MAIIKCKMCGGDLSIQAGVSVAECEYCGTQQTVPSADNEKKLNLFARANRLRASCDFDKASGVYEAIVADFPEEAEAYWGLVLCKFGIEYVDDPGTGKKIPTCHRSSFESVMDDVNFEMTLENADVIARKVYREEAKAIEELRKGIVEVSSKEDPYDIFICYKETDVNGNRTLDSVLAQDIYDALTEKGYRVFFARITLEDKLGQEYEPYIFAALHSAKVMLVVGTDYEYFHAVWVKNEWSRFLSLISAGEKKNLIPCYKGIDAYDLPKEFAKLQAQDMGKIGAIQDLLRGIAKILPQQGNFGSAAEKTDSGLSPLTMRGQFALDDGDWKKAEEYFERALDENPQDGHAYLGKVLVGLHLSSADQINETFVKLEGDKNFERAIHFSSGMDKAKLERIKETADKKWHVKCLANGLRKVMQNKQKEEERKQEEERSKAEAEKLAKNKDRLRIQREKYAGAAGLIGAGAHHIVGLQTNGKVLAVGSNRFGQCDVSKWTDIVSVCTGNEHTVGLRADGTVVATGGNNEGQCNVSDWKNIVAIAAGDSHTVGLRTDGQVVAAGMNGNFQHNVSNWKKIVAICAGRFHTVGLRANGTVVATGGNDKGQCNVSDWKDIVAICARFNYTAGLRADGTVIITGDVSQYSYERSKVSGWKDIVAIFLWGHGLLGLRAGGTLVGLDKKTDLENVVDICVGCGCIFGLRTDGTVVVSGTNRDGMCSVERWKLFQNLGTIAQEREEMQRYRAKGVCQYCGGEWKGLFSKKCASCGRPKDY